MKLWVQHTGERQTPIELEEQPFASGGEGELYEIVSPGYARTVAKIYHPKKRTSLRHQKILYLHENPPKEFEKEEGIHLIWPKQLLFNKNKEFVGFLMKKATGDKLELLTLPKIPKRYLDEWGAYSFDEDKRLFQRLKICHKIAKAIHRLHATEQYILVDMKPDNIVVSPEGNIALVDLDSIEVVKDGETIYDAPVATPEYTPADSYRKWEVDPTQEDPWDRFGLAVIFYKVLLGIHPFAASTGKPFEHLTSIYEKITNGLYVHHPELRSNFKVIPALHERFYSLPTTLQNLFNQCFIDGYNDPFARPSSEEWSMALHEYHQRHFWTKESIAIPPIHLQYLPQQLNTKQLYKIPVATIISQSPILEIEKPITKKELKAQHLPKEINNPKELRSQRFFNFIIALLILVIGAGISLITPWYLAVIGGVLAYLGFNLMTYKTRKSAEKKQTIFNVFESQMSYLEELIHSIKRYESKIQESITKITTLQKETPPDYLEDILTHKRMLSERISLFEQYAKRRRVDLRKIKREEKNEYNELKKYYYLKSKEVTTIQTIEAPTPLQYIILLKRNHRLGKLSETENNAFEQDLYQLELLKTQKEIEIAELEDKYVERSKDIIFSVVESHKTILEEVERYHQLVTKEDENKVKQLMEQQKISLSELERLEFDLQRLEKPLIEQAATCRRAKINADLYKKISYPRHLLEMIGILRPF
jgi:DNA-binding helix-hairpin-helix protein with protein kinase domain